MYKRFFAFGCSFTNFYWPTWADIIGKEFAEKTYHNYGLDGTGNESVFHRLTETHARYNINQDDLVIICWTNFAREDRYIKGAWIPSGNVLTYHNRYPSEWVKKYFDLRGALLKTSSVITGATHLLDSTGCEYHFTSMMPMSFINQQDIIFADLEYQDIFDVYKKYYDKIKISMVEQLYVSLPVCRNPRPATIKYKEEDKESFLDHHPTPKQHLKYVEDIILPSLSQPLIISNDTKLWAQDWDDRIHNAKPYFKCSVDGWSLDYRYKKYQGHLC